MGGAIGEGNRTPAAEFNIWADPEAAQRVFEEGLDTTMVGLDVTHRALIKDEHTERMRGAGRVGKVVAELMDFYARFHKRRYTDLDGSPMHDPVCIAHLIDPTLMDVHDAYIEVDCTTGPSWGRTNVDWRGREHFGAPNAKVGLDIDGAAVRRAGRRADQRRSDDRLRRDRAARQSGLRAAGRTDRDTACTSSRAGSRRAAPRRRSSRRRTARSSTATSASCARRASPSIRTSSSTPRTSLRGRRRPGARRRVRARASRSGAAGARPHVRDDCRRRLDDAGRLGRRHPAQLPPNPGGGRDAVPCLVERRSCQSWCRPSLRATDDRPVAFVASADHGHGHTHDGPYGFSEHSAPYDDDVQDVVRRNALGELAGWDPQRADDALADSLWQMLMLHGALGGALPKPSSCRTRHRPTSGCSPPRSSGRTEPRRGEVPRHGAQEAAPPHVPENAQPGQEAPDPRSRAANSTSRSRIPSSSGSGSSARASSSPLSCGSGSAVGRSRMP